MGRFCKVCEHSNRARLELGLANGIGFRRLAQTFPGLSQDSLRRHKINHMSPKQIVELLVGKKLPDEMMQEIRDREADGILHQMMNIRAIAWERLDMAREVGEEKTIQGYLRELRGVIKDEAELLGMLGVKSQHLHINLSQAPEWVEVKAVLLAALAKYPDAQIAVLDALERVGKPMKVIEANGHDRVITA